MSKKKKKTFSMLTPQDQLKYEIAQELGLLDKVVEKGWESLSAKEAGRIGGIMAGRKKQMKHEAMRQDTEC